MSQLHQMISNLQSRNITYVHTVQRETISIDETLEKAVMSDKVNLILKSRTQMVESIYKYFEFSIESCQNLIESSYIMIYLHTTGPEVQD